MEKAEIALIKKKLSLRNDDIEFARNQRLKRLEDENRLLSLSLDEANKQNREKQLKILVLTNEGMSLKSLMSDLEIKCLEATKEARTPKASSDCKMKELEERCKKSEEELQSMCNQLSNIEDEYMKLQQQFQENKSAWEREKSLLMNETHKLLESVNSNSNDQNKLPSPAIVDQEVTSQRHLVKKVEENLSQAQKINEMKIQIREEKKKREDNLSRDDEEKLIRLEDESEMKKIELQEEIEKFKGMLDESSNYQFSLMEEVEELTAQMEKLDSELSDKSRIESELQYELQVWRSLAEYLAAQVDENIATRKTLEGSLLAQAEIEDTLRKQIQNLNKKLGAV